jgi:Spy/CpxP family protein refolding chaperone
MRLSKLGTILLALALAFPLLAQKENPGACQKGCGIPDLTAEQTAKFQKLGIEHQKAMLPLQAELKAKQLDLHQLLMEGADQKKLEAKIDEIAKANADIQKKCVFHRSEALRLLTAEQKKAMTQGCMGMAAGCGVAGHGAGCGMNANSGCCGEQGGCGDANSCGSSKKPGCGTEKKAGCASKGECPGDCGKK